MVVCIQNAINLANLATASRLTHCKQKAPVLQSVVQCIGVQRYRLTRVCNHVSFQRT